jgi:DNA-binding transcriptional LysR family regulator
LIRKKLMSIQMQLYATRDYLTKMGAPTEISGISEHRLICQNPQSAQVSAGATMVQDLMSHAPHSLLTVNNYFGVLQAVLHDLGIGALPDYLIEDFPELVRVLPEYESADVPVFLAYPEELRHSKRISAFRDFVQEEIITHRKQLRQRAAK